MYLFYLRIPLFLPLSLCIWKLQTPGLMQMKYSLFIVSFLRCLDWENCNFKTCIAGRMIWSWLFYFTFLLSKHYYTIMVSKCLGLQSFKCPDSTHAELWVKSMQVYCISQLSFLNSWLEHEQKDKGLKWNLPKVPRSALGSKNKKWFSGMTVLPLCKCVWAFREILGLCCSLKLFCLTGKIGESDL